MKSAKGRAVCYCGNPKQVRSDRCAFCTRMISMKPAVEFALRFELIEVIDFLQGLGPEWKEIPGALDLCYGIKNGQRVIRRQVEVFWENTMALGYDRVMPGVIIKPSAERRHKRT